MAGTPARTLMTAEDLLQLPDDGNWYELSEGELIVLSPAAYWSSMVAAAFLVRIRAYVLENGLGIVAGPDGGMLLRRAPDTMRAPDVSFVRRDRVPANIAASGFIPAAPDLAVEVLSPSDRYSQVSRKIRDYFAAGTRLVWVVDPDDRVTMVHHPDRPVEIIGPEGTLDGGEILPGFTLSLAELWAEMDEGA